MNVPASDVRVPDRAALSLFLSTMFRHADPVSFISLRAFLQKSRRGANRTVALDSVKAGAPDLDDRAYAMAIRAANVPAPAAFYVPIGTSRVDGSAKTRDLAQGLAISVECDEGAQAALVKLTVVLGPPTVVVASGGQWINPLGVEHPKLHLHWRLAEPATTLESFELLAEARSLARQFVSGDPTCDPIVHPLRVPGGWHRKEGKPPTRVTMQSCEPDVEVDLAAAVAALRLAVPEPEIRARSTAAVPENLRGDEQDIAAALAVIPNDNLAWEAWNRVLMASWAASYGHAFEAAEAWSAKSDKHEPEEFEARWNHFGSCPPDRVGMGTLLRMAIDARPGWTSPSFQRAAAENHQQVAERFFEPTPEAALFPAPAAEPRQKRLKTLCAFLSGYVPLEYAVEPLMRTGSLYSLTARTGADKTAFLISTSYAVITGRKEIIGLEVERGRVAYLTFENPDDVRMRMMVSAHRLGIDIDAVSDRLLVIDTRDKPEMVLVELAEAAAIEPLRLIVVDTFAAFFDGDNVNDPVQGGEFMRRLRPMTRLPGLPAVVVASHPVKNAGEDQLVPYGSGAILNEVDGNLTLWRRSETGTVKLHWQGKLRGLEFEPREFRFEISGSPDVIDAKSRLVKLPTLLPAESLDAEAQDASERNIGIAIMKAMDTEPTATQRRWAELASCSQTLVHRHLSKLAKEKLVEKALGHWSTTAKGRKELERWA